MHYLPNENYQEVVEEIESYLNKVAEADIWLRDNPLQFEWGGSSMIEDKGEIFPSFTLPTEHPGLKMLAKAHEKVVESPLQQGISTTVTDGGWLNYFDIPTILYGPGELKEAHSVNEKIKIKDLENFSDVLYQFLKEWYSNPEKL